MPEFVRTLPPFRKVEKNLMGFLTWQQSLTLFGALFIALGISWLLINMVAPGTSLQTRGVVALVTFVFLSILGMAKYKNTMLLLYLLAVIGYKLAPKKYEKPHSSTSRYPATQTWLGIEEIKNDVVICPRTKKEQMFFTLLEVSPIDLSLRTAEAADIVYSRTATAYNTLNFPIQIISFPIKYDPSNYIKSWEENLRHYSDTPYALEYIQNHLYNFKKMIEETGLLVRKFYIVTQSKTSQTAPKLFIKEKEELRVEGDVNKKKEITKKYLNKRLEAAINDLRLKKITVKSAFEAIDPDLRIIELSNETLLEALANCFGGRET